MQRFTYRLLSLTVGAAILAWFAGAWGTLLANAGSADAPTTGTSSIALFEFAAPDTPGSEVAARVRQMIKERLSLQSFAVSDAAGFGTNRFNRVPDFTVWQSPDIRFLVQGTTTLKDAATVMVEARVWDVRAQKFLTGQRVKSRTDDLPGAVDTIASAIGSDVKHSDEAAR